MKKFLLFTALSACFLAGKAQPVINGTNTGPIKLSDVIEAHQSQPKSFDEEEEEWDSKGKKIEKEGKDYFFDRWLWYWQQHTDENGYLVSPIQTYLEWNRYKNVQHKTTLANQSNWSFQGPDMSPGGYSGIGRVTSVEFHPTNKDIYWACTAGGGIWKTIDNGMHWTSLTDNLSILGTSDLDVNPQNPNTMYLCTGDRDASDTYSIGVLKSLDGGQTWNTTGLIWTSSQFRLTNCLVINKIDTNSLTLASSDGIYKTYNGGANWTRTQTGNFKQVLYNPIDTNILYATTYSPANIYRSKDGGKTWATVTSFTGMGRITLATSPANVSVVKAIVTKSYNNGLEGIYSSKDTGKNFIKIYGPNGCNGDLISNANSNSPSSCGDQGWYDLSIAMDPNDTAKVLVGGVNTWRSTNGGRTWNIVTQWYAQSSGIATVHADKHGLLFHPLVPGRLFECNDGGLYYTDNPASVSAWNYIGSGIGNTQFYRNAVSNIATFVLGGAQDNGTKMLQGGAWYDANGGDGMDCQIDYVDSETYYTAVQYGDIYRTSTNWGDALISNNVPGQPTGGWITPYIISPVNHDELLAGYQDIFWSGDAGNTWTSITGGHLSGNKNLLRLAMTPCSDSTIYAVLENSNKVFYTHKFVSGNVAPFDSLTAPYSSSYSISDIKVDPKDRLHFWVTFNGYGGPQVAEYNAGVWTKINTNLPNVPVHCFERDSSNGIMYVGTDVGVFYMDTATAPNWMPFNVNLPSIEVTDLAVKYNTKELWASTYGRGMWKSSIQLYTIDTSGNDTSGNDTTRAAINIIPYVPGSFTLSPNPNTGHFSIKASDNHLYGKAASIIIMDNMGRVIYKDDKPFDASGRIDINTNGLAKAVYIVEISSGQNILGRQRMITN